MDFCVVCKGHEMCRPSHWYLRPVNGAHVKIGEGGISVSHKWSEKISLFQL